MKILVLASVAGALAAGSAAQASPNLVTNGSFESGSGGAGATGTFTGWTVSNVSTGVAPGKGPEYITYGANATGYGDNVPADPFSFSPDASGSHAAFFVDDQATETLSQSIGITAGTIYEVGFDFFETNSGAANPNPFSLTAKLNGSTIASITSGVTYGAGTWYHVFQTFTSATAGTSGFAFTYLSGNQPAKDVIVDDVYVEVAPPADVPEPVSMALLGVGLSAVMLLGMRRQIG